MFLPATDSVLPWTALLLGLWIPNFYYWGLNQYITQRTLGSASLAQGQKGIVFAAFMKLLIPFVIVIPGIIAFNLYSSDMQTRGACATMRPSGQVPEGQPGDAAGRDRAERRRRSRSPPGRPGRFLHRASTRSDRPSMRVKARNPYVLPHHAGRLRRHRRRAVHGLHVRGPGLEARESGSWPRRWLPTTRRSRRRPRPPGTDVDDREAHRLQVRHRAGPAARQRPAAGHRAGGLRAGRPARRGRQLAGGHAQRGLHDLRRWTSSRSYISPNAAAEDGGPARAGPPWWYSRSWRSCWLRSWATRRSATASSRSSRRARASSRRASWRSSSSACSCGRAPPIGRRRRAC